MLRGDLDLEDPEIGRELFKACDREAVELTGEVGDVFLLHPLTLHGASSNQLERPRWMVNPLVELVRPVDLKARPPSPVARLLLEAAR